MGIPLHDWMGKGVLQIPNRESRHPSSMEEKYIRECGDMAT